MITLTPGGAADEFCEWPSAVAGSGFATANQVLPQTDGSVILVAGIAGSEGQAVQGNSEVAVTRVLPSGKSTRRLGTRGRLW